MITRENLNPATVRTVIPGFVGLLLAYIRIRLGWELSPLEDAMLVAVALAVVGLYYRFARVAEVRWPTVAWLLLGSKKVPAAYIDANVAPAVSAALQPVATTTADAVKSGDAIAIQATTSTGSTIATITTAGEAHTSTDPTMTSTPPETPDG